MKAVEILEELDMKVKCWCGAEGLSSELSHDELDDGGYGGLGKFECYYGRGTCLADWRISSLRGLTVPSKPNRIKTCRPSPSPAALILIRGYTVNGLHNPERLCIGLTPLVTGGAKV